MQPPALSVRDIEKSFGTHKVIRGISLTARDGEVVSILGASGSGKSTFLRCINMLETIDAGEIAVAGETIAMKRGKSGALVPADRRQMDRIRASLGMVFQSFNLWSHMTVLENVIEGPIHVQKRPRADVIAEAEALLQKVGLAERRNHYRRISPAASSSVRRSPVRSPCGRRRCCSTSRPRPSIRNSSARCYA